MNYVFHILGKSSQLTFIFFRGIETTNQLCFYGWNTNLMNFCEFTRFAGWKHVNSTSLCCVFRILGGLDPHSSQTVGIYIWLNPNCCWVKLWKTMLSPHPKPSQWLKRSFSGGFSECFCSSSCWMARCSISGHRRSGYWKWPCSMEKSTISMVMFNSYFDITRG